MREDHSLIDKIIIDIASHSLLCISLPFLDKILFVYALAMSPVQVSMKH
jgi:hypothetical protein